MITWEVWDEYMIASHWLGIIFNHDCCGLDDQEILDAEAWFDEVRGAIAEEKGTEKFIILPVIISEEKIFGRDEISGAFADCWMIELRINLTGDRSPKPGKGKSSGKKSIK